MVANRNSAVTNDQLKLGIFLRFDKTGQLFDPATISHVDIYDAETGFVLETILPPNITKISIGKYQVLTQAHAVWNITPRTITDKWSYTIIDSDVVYVSEQSTIVTAGVAAVSATPVLGFPTVSEIRNKFLRGVKLFDEFGDDMPDEMIQDFIDTSICWLERELLIDITERKVVGDPALPEDGDYDIIEPRYDFDMNDYMQWGYIKLWRKPVKEVTYAQFIYPTGQNIMVIPQAWIKIASHKQGHLHFIPTAGTLATVMVGSAGGMFLPALSAGIIGNVPYFTKINYTTGLDEIPRDMWKAAGMKACIDILTIISDSLTQGITSDSISTDGLSMNVSRSNSQSALLYQARIDNYERSLTAYLSTAYSFYHGVYGLTVL